MLPAPSPFEQYHDADVRALIDSYPLAWVMSASGGEASQLPLIGVFDAVGCLTELIGHFAANNPLRSAFAADSRAIILFNGPDGYISPAQAGNRDWAPTWNFAHAQIRADISVDPDLTEGALGVLIEKMEAKAAQPWTVRELGERYHTMLPRIIGFRAKVTALQARFKLGQDETPETLRSILAHLPDPALADWMHRFNQGRLG